jgi:hypothetical protein
MFGAVHVVGVIQAFGQGTNAKVFSAAVTVPAGSQTYGSVSCPTGTVVYGGGALTPSDDPAVNINSSWPIPSGAGWQVYLNNGSASATTLTVSAECAKAPADYQIVTTGPIDDPAETTQYLDSLCPLTAGVKVLGGGGYSSSPETTVNFNRSMPFLGTHPKTYSWLLYVANMGSDDNSMTAYAICGKVPKYSVVVAQFANASGLTDVTASCPSGTVVLGGGAELNNGALSINETAASSTSSRTSYAVVPGSLDATLYSAAICGT